MEFPPDAAVILSLKPSFPFAYEFISLLQIDAGMQLCVFVIGCILHDLLKFLQEGWWSRSENGNK